MQPTPAPFLQPHGGTGRTQNQRNHGNDRDALERGAIAEIRRADAPSHIFDVQIRVPALVLVVL